MTISAAKLVDAALAGDPLTDDALALNFSARHAHDLRYVSTVPQWFCWDGTRWRPESTLLAFDLARESIRLDAMTYGNGKPPSHVSSAKTVAAIERLARADRRQAATLDQFDRDKWFLTTPGRTIDLRTGEDRRPEPADYITKTTSCGPSPPEHPLWTAFLDRITAADVDLQDFLQRYVGYCLTGDTSEHAFVFCYGTGANGKSTFINLLAWLFGDYATTSPMDTFVVHHTEPHPTNVAKLHGARLVVAQETEKGRRWDEAKLKALTGGDVISARFMRGDYFDFRPAFKLFIVGNHKPRLENVDEAMRRRLLLVPFTVQIPAQERDPGLPERLKAEAPAILRWAIEGCLKWQSDGLAPPKIVTDATEAYFADQDMVGQWMEDCIERTAPTAFVKIGEVYASWKGWCDNRNHRPGGINSLSEELHERRGLNRVRMTGGTRGFAGVKLKWESTAQ